MKFRVFENIHILSSGRGGVANQPWLGSWNDNVTVTLVACGEAKPVINRVKKVNPIDVSIGAKNTKNDGERTVKDYAINNSVLPARYFDQNYPLLPFYFCLTFCVVLGDLPGATLKVVHK